jgi:hypothetical protein
VCIYNLEERNMAIFFHLFSRLHSAYPKGNPKSKICIIPRHSNALGHINQKNYQYQI